MTADLLAAAPAADLIAAINVFPRMLTVLFQIIAVAICLGIAAVVASLAATMFSLRTRSDRESKADKARVAELRRRMSPRYAPPETHHHRAAHDRRG